MTSWTLSSEVSNDLVKQGEGNITLHSYWSHAQPIDAVALGFWIVATELSNLSTSTKFTSFKVFHIGCCTELINTSYVWFLVVLHLIRCLPIECMCQGSELKPCRVLHGLHLCEILHLLTCKSSHVEHVIRLPSINLYYFNLLFIGYPKALLMVTSSIIQYSQTLLI